MHEEILATIRQSGGISKDQLKEELPYTAKEITAALKKMQEAFLVYEEQIDSDWNTGWFDFATEWFTIEHEQGLDAAISEMLLTFLDAFVFATVAQMKSWSQLKNTLIEKGLQRLLAEKRVINVKIDGLGEGIIRSEDTDLPHQEAPASVFMLDQSDFFVRAYLDELKQAYKGREVLQYLLIDGEFKGAVLGHWRIGPHDIEDIELQLERTEAANRQDEIVAAIRKGYTAESTNILRFNGDAL